MLTIDDLFEIKRLYNKGKRYDEISLELDIPEYTIERNCSNNCKVLEARINRYYDKLEEEKRICEIIKKSNNLNCVCSVLGKKATNNNYNKLRKIIKKYNIDTSHFKYTGCFKTKRKLTKDDYFVKNSKIASSIIREKLFEFCLKPRKCEKCGRTTWTIDNIEHSIPLQVHHIDGDRSNNELNNLMVLCPNCHTFTDNYCGKKLRKKTKEKNNEPFYANKREKITKICKFCGKEFQTNEENQQFCSKKCANEQNRKCVRPPKEELEKLIIMKSYRELGRMFGVTDNTIKKWCIRYGIDKYKKKDLGLYYRFEKNICKNCVKEFNGRKKENSFCSKECEIIYLFNEFNKRITNIDKEKLTQDLKNNKHTLYSISKKYEVRRCDMYRFLTLNNIANLLKTQPKGKCYESILNNVKRYLDIKKR